MPIVLVIAALVVGRWDVIRNYWDRLTRGVSSESIALHAISTDTEYFCPMDPGIVSDWPGKCGICNMALVRRKRGEAVLLPDGVVARMQLSPYRIQLAGIQTAPAAFRPLCGSWNHRGSWPARATAPSCRLEMSARQAPWVAEGQSRRSPVPDLPGHDPLAGRVRSLARDMAGGWEYVRITIAIEKPPSRRFAPGMIAVVRFRGADGRARSVPLAARREPAASVRPSPGGGVTSAGPPGEIVARGRALSDRSERQRTSFADRAQRLRWWCPMHPDVTADQPARGRDLLAGCCSTPRVVSYHPAGPGPGRAAVGGRSVRTSSQDMPGMFDAKCRSHGESCRAGRIATRPSARRRRLPARLLDRGGAGGLEAGGDTSPPVTRTAAARARRGNSP